MKYEKTLHLERLIAILEIIAVSGRAISVSNIQKATALPKPTVYRLCSALADHQLIDSDEDNSRYVIGERLIRIALLGKSDVDVRRVAAPILAKSAIKFGETVYLSRYRNGGIDIIHVETPNDPTRGHIYPGLGPLPQNCMASAFVMAAFAEDPFRQEILNNVINPYKEARNNAKGAAPLDLDPVRVAGFAHIEQATEFGATSISAPISIGTLGATFAIGVVGPNDRLLEDTTQKIGKELIKISSQMGGAIQLCNVSEV
ncbi:MAG: IclR family transcriptional regulator [Paracoccaceae bacterium]